MFGIRIIKWKNWKSVFTIQNKELKEMVKTKERKKELYIFFLLCEGTGN